MATGKQGIVVDRQTVGYAVMLLMLFQQSQGFPVATDGSAGLWQWPMTLALVGTLYVLAAYGFACQREFGVRFVGLFTGIIVFGCATVLGAALDLVPAVPSLGIGAFLLGVGVGASFACWQRLLAKGDVAAARRRVALGTAMASLADIVFIQIDSPFASLGLIALGAGLNARILMGIHQEGGVRASTKGENRPQFSFKGLVLSIWRYVLCVGVIGFAARTSSAVASEMMGMPLNGWMAVAMLASSIIMMGLWLKWRLSSVQRIFTVLLAAVAAVFLAMILLPQAIVPLVASMAFCAFSIASMLMVVATIEIAQSRDADPTFVFGVFAGSVYLLADVGPLLTGALEAHLGLSSVVVVSVSVIYLVSLSGLAFNFTREGRSAEEIGVSEDGEKVSDVSERFVHPVVVRQDMIPLCCALLRQRYRLTVRETEILELVARGRDQLRMAEALFVSQNTVRSHMRNLYRKMDVHSRQEALDLLDQAKGEILSK